MGCYYILNKLPIIYQQLIDMGFHAVAVGLHFGHGDIKKILQFIAKKVWIDGEICDDFNAIDTDDDERTIKIKLKKDIVAKERDPVTKKKYFTNKLELDLADFSCNSYKLYYAKNPKIKIGSAHCCAWMIYLGCVGDDLGGKKGPIPIEMDLLVELEEWRQKLVYKNKNFTEY